METQKLEKDLQGLIDQWAPFERDNWPTSNDTDPLMAQLHRTALLALAGVRKAQSEARDAMILNAQFGNIVPGFEQYGHSTVNTNVA